MEQFSEITKVLFIVDLIVHYVLLAAIVWSVAVAEKRIWPPPRKKSWQYILTWILFYLAFFLNALILIGNWNTWILTDIERFTLGIPLTVVGAWMLLWGILRLGTRNTSGQKDGFVHRGPYRFTRNPQYLGDAIMFIGIILISNSLYILVLNSLLTLVFLLTPLAEEPWLEQQYGEPYKSYKQSTPRFL